MHASIHDWTNTAFLELNIYCAYICTKGLSSPVSMQLDKPLYPPNVIVYLITIDNTKLMMYMCAQNIKFYDYHFAEITT